MSVMWVEDDGAVTSLSYVTEDGGISTTVTIPASAAVGDLAILVNAARGASAPALVTPAGWTNLVNMADAAQRITAHYKVLASGEPGSVLTGMDGSFAETLQILIFRPNAPINTVTPSTFSSQVTGADPTLQTVSASGQTVPLLVLGCLTDQEITAPAFSTASPAFDAEIAEAGSGSAIAIRTGYKIYNSSPADHSVDMADEGSGNGLWSGYLKLT